MLKFREAYKEILLDIASDADSFASFKKRVRHLGIEECAKRQLPQL
jgi:hypothetical protein